MSTRLLRANSSARDGVSKSSRLSLPSICRTISASSRRLENRSSTIRTVFRWARANASSETMPGERGRAQRRGRRHRVPPGDGVPDWPCKQESRRAGSTPPARLTGRDGAPIRVRRVRGIRVVGARRFELPTPCTPCRCATRLRYAPTETPHYTGPAAHVRSGASSRLRGFPRALDATRRNRVRMRARRRTGRRPHRGRSWRRARGRARLVDVGLEPVARAVDRESLLVEEVADAPDQQHFVVLVVAPVAPPLHGLQLRELLLPVAQHVRLHRAQVADLADREIALGGDRRAGRR